MAIVIYLYCLSIAIATFKVLDLVDSVIDKPNKSLVLGFANAIARTEEKLTILSV
ncbi:MAG: hypothetical protein MUD14_27385 [Hydrococcus sp. Prado102]|nr:hypothetical protein [Hydrococcus sp. Prado102]